MKKIAVVYYSSTGNTEEMANAVLQGCNEGHSEARLFKVSDISASEALEYDTLILGCPAMGAEELEDSEMEPFMSELEGSLAGKSVGLFGSYGWGDGEWMRNWEERCVAAGANLVAEPVIANEAPDGEALDACRNLGLEASK